MPALRTRFSVLPWCKHGYTEPSANCLGRVSWRRLPRRGRPVRSVREHSALPGGGFPAVSVRPATPWRVLSSSRELTGETEVTVKLLAYRSYLGHRNPWA